MVVASESEAKVYCVVPSLPSGLHADAETDAEAEAETEAVEPSSFGSVVGMEEAARASLPTCACVVVTEEDILPSVWDPSVWDPSVWDRRAGSGVGPGPGPGPGRLLAEAEWLASNRSLDRASSCLRVTWKLCRA